MTPPKELLIFAGADEMTVSAFYAGAHGAIGSTWNYWGQSAVAVWKQLAASRMNPQAALAYSTRLSISDLEHSQSRSKSPAVFTLLLCPNGIA